MSRRLLLFAGALLTMGAPVAAGAQGPIEAAIERIRAASDQARHDDAVGLARELRERFPDHPNVVLSQAEALVRAGYLDEAAAKVDRLQRWDPTYAVVALGRPHLAPFQRRFDSLALARSGG